MIVLLEPSIDLHLSLFDTVKPFGVEDLMKKDAIKAFVVPVFPRAALKDLNRRYTSLCKPIIGIHSGFRAANSLAIKLTQIKMI